MMSKSPKSTKTSDKGKNRLSLDKKNRPTHSIISLFKKQSRKCNADLRTVTDRPRETRPLSLSSDDDCKIIEVETVTRADKYFGSKETAQFPKDDSDESKKLTGSSYASKLHLRRGRSSLQKSDDADRKQGDVINVVDGKSKTKAGGSQSSQKENYQKGGLSAGDAKLYPSKLSLRKRSLVNNQIEGSSSGSEAKLHKTDTSDVSDVADKSSPPGRGLAESNIKAKKRSSNEPKSLVQPLGKSPKIAKSFISRSPKQKSTASAKEISLGDHATGGSNHAERDTSSSSQTSNSSVHPANSSNRPTCSSKHSSIIEPPTSTGDGACDSSTPSTISKDGNQIDLNLDKIEQSLEDGSVEGADCLDVGEGTSREMGVGDEAGVGDQEDKAKYRDRIPYYLENFRITLDSVLDDADNKCLFNDEDMKVVNCFRSLSEPGQKLYVRLFSRKLTWHRFNKISYAEIADDLNPVLQELISCGLAISDAELTELEEIVRLLPAVQLKTLAKSFSINSTGQQKGQLVEALLKQSKQSTIGSFFTKSAKAGANVMLERAKKLLGHSVKLLEEPRMVFVRALMLFSLINTSPDEESANGGQTQLFQMMLVNMGKLVYPKYTINKQSSIFQNREELLRFSTAMLLEYDLLICTEKGNYDGAHELYLAAKTTFEELKQDEDLVKWDTSLPSFLRRYTASEIYTRVLSEGVEILQRMKKYELAVEQLRTLLSQTTYCLNYHGHWFDRLALNLDQHLKKTAESLVVIGDGLRDSWVRVGHRYSLYWRAEKICKARKSKYTKDLTDIPVVEIRDYPKVTIEGKVIPKTIPGARFTFLTENSDSEEEGVTVCGVEELVLDYYKQHGFPEGIHAEGGLVSTLFSLYFWDILFADIPDAFHSPFQACPLDYHSDHFYEARKSLIDDRLQEISDKTEEELGEMLSLTWEAQNEVRCTGLNWERFTGLEHAQGFVGCMGGTALAGLLARFAKDPRHTRSGFPDLTLWNPGNKTFKFSEVKGPGDRLSHNQIMWLDYLVSLGVDAEVCHVKAVTGKKLTRKFSEDATDGYD